MEILLALCVAIVGFEKADSFQIPQKSSNDYKSIIEITTNTPVSDITSSYIPVDDDTYSPELPCEHSQQKAINDSMYIKSVPKDDMISTSDSLLLKHQIYQHGFRQPAALPLSSSGITNRIVPPARKAHSRKRFCLDDMPAEYWFDNRIHTFGNTGFFGGFHAALAPLTTWLIDIFAYDKQDVRAQIANDLRKCVNTPNARVLDLCSGVGMSTRALSAAFQNAELVCGIDTSPEMIEMARFISKYQEVRRILRSGRLFSNFVETITALSRTLLSPDSKISSAPMYARGNAERVKVQEGTFDLVTIWYAFHEIPKSARYRVLREARRLLKDGGTLAVLDISVDFNPTEMMLAGEPYVLEYKENIMEQMGSIRGFCDVQSITVVPGHVHLWLLSRNTRYS